MKLYSIIISLLLPLTIAQTSNPKVSLKLDIQHPSTLESYELSCDPVGGNHPHPIQACDLLNSINGDLVAFDSIFIPCAKSKRPAVNVTIQGTYYGAPIHFERTHKNYKCAQTVMNGLYP
ncbi:uncharacterized protein B0P05DRAFT_543397 [Gilbertella persicaria]|uniref:Subtilisin inhibitor domain-containing protein n=1 Tax=Rhizopus stolonifer TaxID=4846 RepID=A0A367KNS8_RHIST|nr:uncharacterized protein B0P05DRAFT_543397 [Gilbertella persicaria]KAI8077936.1 hypothetical protein B0P05DRAFT_543397 [Gilbertella persicaria]RCI03895.1 hypothetical protein CU098_008087 [Rhizopus stolonifer]